MRKAAAGFAGLLLAAALWQALAAAWIPAKASLAQLLLERSWQAGQGAPAPWPWADFFPRARLRLGRSESIVLSDASPRTLAFGPGLFRAGALFGASGPSIISGHRDTQFAALRYLTVGSEIGLELPDGRARRLVVRTTAVVDTRRPLALADCGPGCLLLVSCYPFDGLLPGTPLRFVVEAHAVPARSLPLQAL
ncbi:MAG: sortase [Gammaproteobacteria bacterium]|nr:sortase [Gammaproteobacteria bacterium]